MNDEWKVWDKDEKYGQVLYQRAVGELPEMESSKIIAQVVNKYIIPDAKVLDVGCGAGHYLKSLRRVCGSNFSYLGVDATENYIDQAKKAFVDDKGCDFMLSDIFDLEIKDNSYNIVMSNNVFLHLPSIKKPLSELIRVANGHVIIRLLAGSRSFQIKDIAPQKSGLDFKPNGEPVAWHYYNIYHYKYIESLLKTNKKVKSWAINPDFDYEEESITNSIKDHVDAHDASTILNGYQVNGYIIQPWSIIEIEIDDASVS
jgi:ubiquinone/menaquinone biosynthesis C-methylase UbiE